MQPPPVQYVTTRDGINVAYTLGGKGPPLVFVPNLASHVLLAWDTPHLGDWMRGLSERFTVVRYDSRGMGMSTRGVREDHSVKAYQLDLEAVIEQLQLDRFVLCAQGSGGTIAIPYAVRHPERVAAIVLLSVGGSIQALRAGTLIFRSLAEEDWEMFQYTGASANIASSQDVPRTVEIYKQSVTQEEWLGKFRGGSPDMEAELRNLRTPSLWLHPRNYVGLPVEASMKMAQLSRGQLVLIDGADSHGNATQGINAIEAFLGGLAQKREDTSHSAPTTTPPNLLSPRQIEVLQLITQGKTTREIAEALVLRERTVQRHISDLYTKIDVRNRSEATAFALANLASP